ncbi:Hypothetical protein HVR_LOCUS453 [uncultured virus]|nr:Hypothetical protein HVR_LOCUS453 [uncultured virus]
MYADNLKSVVYNKIMGNGLFKYNNQSNGLLHKQVKVAYKNDCICVDEGMVNILKILWSLGIETRFSCQGNVVVQPFYILFPDKKIFSLLNIIKGTELYVFIERECGIREENEEVYLTMNSDLKDDFEKLLLSMFGKDALLTKDLN